MTGEVTLGAAFAAAVTTCGVTATDSLVSEMVRLDSRLLRHRCTVHADAVTFIRGATDRAEPTALVSNCAENTRPLLDALGLSSLVDAVVLSHEVGSAKPDRGIFVAALAALGSDAADTTLIDDQLAYCRGACAAGLHAVHLTRTGNPPERDPDIPTVASLEEIGLS